MTLKKIAAMATLLCAGYTHAAINDIVVTTTLDEDKDDNQCSLREAITLINQKLASSAAGYHGCGGATGDNTFTTRIVLKSGEVYTLTQGSIDIKESMTIASDQTALLPTNADKPNPVITTSQVQRLFVVDDGDSASTATKAVSFDEVDLRGCGASHPNVSSCTQDSSGNGGILTNNENLSFRKSRITDGRAVNGGALYMATPKEGRISLDQVLMQDNQAEQGGAIWNASTNLTILNSLIRKNTSRQVGSGSTEPGVVIYVSLPPETAQLAASQNIIASTLTENTGYAAILRGGMGINSSTILNNSVGGVYIKSTNLDPKGKPLTPASLANSLIAGNGSAAAPRDCGFDATEATQGNSYLNNLVFMGGCDQHPKLVDNTRALTNLTVLAQAETNPDRQLDLLTLIADANKDGKCDLPPARGLLCPLEKRNEDFVEYYRPRLLISYQKLSDSPLVNKGNETLSSDFKFTGCSGNDQRGKQRVLCDIGAIELKLAETDSNSKTNFADMLYGQGTARIDLSGRSSQNKSEDVLGDGELIPADQCSTVYPGAAVPTGGWLNGCVQYITAPQKGSLYIDNLTNELVYSPNGLWHGEDRFSYNITTTTTRFAEALNDQSITVFTRISQAPDSHFPSYKANMGSGAAGIWSVLGLMGLAWMRRRAGKGE